MSLYSRYILPKATHLVCGVEQIRQQRRKLVPRASGRILEVGFGSGLNLPFYDARKVEKVWGLDPSPEMVGIAKKALHEVPFEVSIIGLAGEEIPLDDRSIDTIVMTYTLCSIADTRKALQQMARVLKPGGKLLFCEHGLAPELNVRSWQNRLTPVWKRLAGGCHLNRDIPERIIQSGFQVSELETGYISRLRFVGFNYLGTAVHTQ